MDVSIKRIYDELSADDGFRVLVDRLWPRGVSKERARLDGWLKELAPSSDLRVWFGHKPENFAEFTHLYHAELVKNSAVIELKKLVAESHVRKLTLLYAARDPQINHAQVLAEFLRDLV